MTMRLRREPPRFRRVAVRETERLSPRLVRVTLTGDELEGFETPQPAASVRLLLPSPGGELVVPEWKGNEFLLPDGSRPVIRTLTPRRADPAARELDVWVVDHGEGAASEWANAATPGDAVAVSGPGRGYSVDPDAPGYLVAGDETALAAMAQLLEAVPHDVPVDVHVEAPPEARIPLPEHPRATVGWGGPILDAVAVADIAEGTRVWVAGEAADVQRVRHHLFEERGVPRAQTSVRGYWKRGRSGDAGDDA